MVKRVDVTGCHDCPYYSVRNEEMMADCGAPDGPGAFIMPINTSAPFDRPLKPPDECPLRKGTVKVRLDVGLVE